MPSQEGGETYTNGHGNYERASGRPWGAGCREGDAEKPLVGSAELRGTRGPAAPPLLSGRLGRRSGGAKLAKTRRRCFGAAGLAKEQRPPRQGLSPASLNRSRSLCAKAATAASRRAAPAPARAQVRRCCRPQGSSRGARAPPETTAAPPGRGAGSPLAAPPALFGHGAFRSRRRPAATLLAPGDNPPVAARVTESCDPRGLPSPPPGSFWADPEGGEGAGEPGSSRRPPGTQPARGEPAPVAVPPPSPPPGPARRKGRPPAARPGRGGRQRLLRAAGGAGRAGQGRAGRRRGRGAGRSQAVAGTSRAPHAPAQRGPGRGGGGGTWDRAAATRGARPGARSGAPRRAGTGGRAARPPPPLPLPAAPTARLQVPGWESHGPGSGGGGSRGAEPSRGGLPSPNSAAPAAPAGPPRRRRPRVPPRRAVREGRVRRRVPPSPAPGAEARGGPGARRHRGSVSAPRRAPPLLRPAGSWRQATGRLLAPLGMSAAAAVRASHVYCR